MAPIDPAVRPASQRFDPEDLLDNAAWMRRLALRLVRDESQADDILQQAYLVAMRRPPRQRAALRGWLRRVVHSLAYRNHRDLARRQRRESDATQRATPAAPDAVAERVEMQHAIVGLVLALDEPHRTTLLLRFFDDLSPAEIARIQGVAVTTVRSRLTRTLRSLRGQLDRRHGRGAGAWATALLGIDETTRAGAGATLAWSTPLGATAMTGKTTFALLTIPLALLLGGLGGWQLADRGAAEEPVPVAPEVGTDDAPRATRAGDRARTQRLEQENARLRAEVARLEALANAPADAAETDGPPEPSTDPDGPLDWSALSSLMAQSIDPLRRRRVDADLSPTDELHLTHLRAEVSKLGAAARARTEQPFFDERVLPRFVVAMSQEALGLTDEQSARIESAARAVVAAAPPDAARRRGSERYRLRGRMTQELLQDVEEVLEPDQVDTWGIVREYIEGLLRYGGRMTVGIDVGAPGFIRNWLANALPEHADDIASEDLVPATTAYFDRSAALVAAYGATNEELRLLAPAATAELSARFLDSQLQFERDVAEVLSSEQAQALHAAEPMIIRFRYGGGISISGSGGSEF